MLDLRVQLHVLRVGERVAQRVGAHAEALGCVHEAVDHLDEAISRLGERPDRGFGGPRPRG